MALSHQTSGEGPDHWCVCVDQFAALIRYFILRRTGVHGANYCSQSKQI